MQRRSVAILLILSCLLAAAGSSLFLILDAGERKIAGLAQLSGDPVRRIRAEAATADDAFGRFASYWKACPEAYPDVTLVAVGDIMLSRTVAARIKAKGSAYPFEALAGTLRLADIAFANLETPLTGGRDIKPGEMSFRADPALADELRQAGFSVVSLANNHTPNFGERGLRDTLAGLDAAGLRHAGAGLDQDSAAASAVVEAGGRIFEFLAYTDSRLTPPAYQAAEGHPGTAPMDIETMRRDVARARNRGSVVVVSMHAGVEYAARPDDVQTAFARAAVDAGAELVIGHHPHVVQPVERYKGKFIFYSLGNFIFDQDWSRETRDGLAVRFTFRGGRVARADLLPVVIDESRPRPAAGPDADRILARLKTDLGSTPALMPDGSGGFKLTALASLPGDLPDAGEVRRLRSETADLDQDSRPEAVMLRDGQAKVLDDDGSEVWRSPTEWWVDDLALTDADGDGRPDLSLSVWRNGSFGASKPFWLDGEDARLSDHLFVMDLDGGQVRPLWQSSALVRPNCASLYYDVDGDGRDELIVSEGDYADLPSCRGRFLAVWKWGDWGFVNVWRGPAGNYRDLSKIILPAGPAVLVDLLASG